MIRDVSERRRRPKTAKREKHLHRSALENQPPLSLSQCRMHVCLSSTVPPVIITQTGRQEDRRRSRLHLHLHRLYPYARKGKKRSQEEFSALHAQFWQRRCWSLSLGVQQ